MPKPDLQALCWPARASTARCLGSTPLGGIRLCSPRGQQPLGQGLSQAEKARAWCNAMSGESSPIPPDSNAHAALALTRHACSQPHTDPP
jgi:hypothetical protein